MLLVNAKQMEIDGINIFFRIVAYTVGAVIDIWGCAANSNFRITDFAFQNTFQTKGKSECAAKRIPEETLEVLTCEVLGEGSIDSDMVRSKITAIRAEKNNVVVYCMDDGSEIVKRWKDRSRAESWTPEMKEKARQRALQARRKKE